MNDGRRYLIIYDGSKDSKEETVRKIKACLLADLELPTTEINRIFVDPPSEVISVDSKEKAKKFHIALTVAGAKVRVEASGEDKEDEASTMELTVDTGDKKEEKPAKVWELSLEDADPDPELPSSTLTTEDDDQVDLTIPEEEPKAAEESKETPQFSSAGISLEEDDGNEAPPTTPPPAAKAPPASKDDKKDKGTQILLRPEIEEPKVEATHKSSDTPSPKEEAPPTGEDIAPRVLNKWSGIANPKSSGEEKKTEGDGSKVNIALTSSSDIRRTRAKKSNVLETLKLIIPLLILITTINLVFYFFLNPNYQQTDDILTEIEETDKDLPSQNPAATKEPTPEPTTTPEGPVTPFTSQIEKDNSSFSFDCELEVVKLRNCQISITTSQPQELTPEEIVRGVKRPPWVTRIESDLARFEDGVAKSEARVFIDYDGKKDRIKANVSFNTRSVLGSNQKLLEVMILSGTDNPIKDDSHFSITAPKDGPYVLSIRQPIKLPAAKDPGIVVPAMSPLPTEVPKEKPKE